MAPVICFSSLLLNGSRHLKGSRAKCIRICLRPPSLLSPFLLLLFISFFYFLCPPNLLGLLLSFWLLALALDSWSRSWHNPRARAKSQKLKIRMKSQEQDQEPRVKNQENEQEPRARTERKSKNQEKEQEQWSYSWFLLLALLLLFLLVLALGSCYFSWFLLLFGSLPLPLPLFHER
jgi:hypothetical protein